MYFVAGSTSGLSTLAEQAATTLLVSYYAQNREKQTSIATKLGFGRRVQVNSEWSVSEAAARAGGQFIYRSLLFLSLAAAFADATRGNLRILLSGPKSSAGRPMTDGEQPGPGGWNRIHFIVDDLEAEIDRLKGAGVSFRNEVVSGPGGRQILVEDPSGNLVELFQPAGG